MFRERIGMTQDELAQKLGYSSGSSITKIEKGTMPVPAKKARAFADALNITIEELMGESAPVNVANAIEIITEMDSMQHILRMLSTMDIKKLQQIESIIETFTEE